MTEVSVHSALQRARQTVDRRLPGDPAGDSADARRRAGAWARRPLRRRPRGRRRRRRPRHAYRGRHVRDALVRRVVPRPRPDRRFLADAGRAAAAASLPADERERPAGGRHLPARPVHRRLPRDRARRAHPPRRGGRRSPRSARPRSSPTSACRPSCPAVSPRRGSGPGTSSRSVRRGNRRPPERARRPRASRPSGGGAASAWGRGTGRPTAPARSAR